MKNNGVQVLIALVLVACLVTILVVGFCTKKDNFKPDKYVPTEYVELDEEVNKKEIKFDEEWNKNIYYLYVNYDIGSYEITIDEVGNCVLKSSKIDYTINDDYKKDESYFAITDPEFNKIKLILNHLGEKNLLSRDDYILYYNENELVTESYISDKNYFLDVIKAIEYISLSDEIIENKSSVEYGNEILDRIIIELGLSL